MRRLAAVLLVGALCASGIPSAHAQVPCQEIGELALALPREDAGGDDSGIGGTGRSAGDDDSGIGGTGIYGSITGFASVCVNGLRIHHGPATRFERNGAHASADDLAVGHVVWIRASTRDGRLHADTVEAVSAVIGPLERRVGPQLSVAGRAVKPGSAARLLDADGAPLALGALRLGDTLDVSGIATAEGVIIASRIVRVASTTPTLTGPTLDALLDAAAQLDRLSLEGFAGPMGLRLGPLEVVGSQARARPGERIWVLGAPEGNVLRAEHLTVSPPRPDPTLEPSPIPDPSPGKGATLPRKRGAVDASDLPDLFERGPRGAATSSDPQPPTSTALPSLDGVERVPPAPPEPTIPDVDLAPRVPDATTPVPEKARSVDR